uniref:Uncharacterized protein n=1 Tax=Arundo donax TaxID=35708 RepID=A0A0A9BHE6_ARUDO
MTYFPHQSGTPHTHLDACP